MTRDEARIKLCRAFATLPTDTARADAALQIIWPAVPIHCTGCARTEWLPIKGDYADISSIRDWTYTFDRHDLRCPDCEKGKHDAG